VNENLYVPDSSSEELSRKGTPPDCPEAPAATDDIPSIGESIYGFDQCRTIAIISKFLNSTIYWLPGETFPGPEEGLLFLLTSEP
jgi:hypothetical protein